MDSICAVRGRAGAHYKTGGAVPHGGARCGRENVAGPGVETAGAAHVSRAGGGGVAGARLEGLHVRDAGVQRGELRIYLCDSAAAADFAVESTGVLRDVTGPGV